MATSFLPSPEPVIVNGNGYETYPHPTRESITASGSPCPECSLYCTIFQSMAYDCCREIRSCTTCSDRFEHFHNHQHQPEFFPLNPANGDAQYYHGPAHLHQKHHIHDNKSQHGEFTHKLSHHPQPLNGRHEFSQTTHVNNFVPNHSQVPLYSHSPQTTTHISSFGQSNGLLHSGHIQTTAVSQTPGINNYTQSHHNGVTMDVKDPTLMDDIKSATNQIEKVSVSIKRRSQRNHRNQEGRKRNSEDLCQVCGDRASGYHYNALTCEGCKGFFRRSITNRAKYKCKLGGACEMDTYTRRKCPDCRLKKCKSVGMLEECLLTEIQCQSKRRRKKINKSNKTNGDNSPENGDNDFDIFDFEKNPELDNEMRCLVQNVEEAFQEYQINPEMVKRWENRQTSGSNKERCRLSDVATVHVQVLVEYAKKLAGFSELDPEDQIALLKGSVMQAMLLRNSCGYNHLAEEPNIAKLIDDTGIEKKHLDALFEFFHAIRKLEIDSTQYALLIAVVIFDSDYPHVVHKNRVDYSQNKYILALNWHCRQRKKTGRFIVPKMIECLTSFRTLSHYNTEVVTCWKKRDKLSPLLCEIWDLT